MAEPIIQAYGIGFFWHWFKNTFHPSKTSNANLCHIDSQSVKTASSAHDKGFDGGKKIKGRKRHIAVDTLGNLLSVVVHAANIHDTKAGIFVAKKAFETYPSLRTC
ncbi:transposase, partial [Kingella negevensis]|uniref:transposase n=1 Tax=Kingella negevensis TaxID=1522312 RepID=UPI003CC90C73